MAIHTHSDNMVIPLQVPGGPELLIIAIIFLFFLAIIGGIVGLVVYLLRRRPDRQVPDQERINELEQRVAELEAERDSTDGTDRSESETGSQAAVRD